MNLIEQVEKLLATSSREQMDALYRAANFDLFQKVDTVFVSPDKALEIEAAAIYEAVLNVSVNVQIDCAWETNSLTRTLLTSSPGAGNNEELLMAA